jgi:hypothetical protein
MRLPDPRGDLSAALFEYLAGSRERPLLPEGDGDPLADDDLQLALYCAHELHYGGLEGIDDAREWEAELLEFELAAEAILLARLRREIGDPDAGIRAGDIAERIFAVVEADDEDAPPLSRYIEGRATLEQFQEFVVHRSAYQLKEADPHTFALPRISGPAKAAMVEIQADEYGGGRFERMHSQLFAVTMRELGLDPTPGAYVGKIGASTLAGVNLISAFSLRRRWRGALVGHLAGFEITSPGPNRRYAAGLRRLGVGHPATEFYDEHVEADSVHENIAAYDLAGGLARQHPELAEQIMFGVRALLACERRFAAHLLDAFEGSRSSLLSPQPEPLVV